MHLLKSLLLSTTLTFMMCMFVLVANQTVQSAPHPQSSASIDWQPNCQLSLPFLVPDGEVIGETIACGKLSIPGANNLQIQVVILKARSESPYPDPILYLEGGPGDSVIFEIDSWVDSPLRNNRDIILVDQRGVGYSMIDDVGNCDAFEDDYESLESVNRRCIAFIENSMLVSNLSTVSSAMDMQNLMEVLVGYNGYTNYNVLGSSYGTRLALVIMRDHPLLIRSVILDSVYPLEVEAYETQPLHIQTALNLLYTSCQADTACNAAFPNLQQTVLALGEQLDDNPLEDEDGYDIDGASLGEIIYESLNDTSIIPVLPAIIYWLAAGDYDRAMQLFEDGAPDSAVNRDVFDSYSDAEVEVWEAAYDSYAEAEGVFMAIECQEELYFSDILQTRRIINENAINPSIAANHLDDSEFMFNSCPFWQTSPPPQSANESVDSDIPTLIVSGEFDPNTPPVWAAQTHANLANSQLVIFPAHGHGITDEHPCIDDIYQQFLTNPTQTPTAECINTMQIEFYIPPVLRN